MLVLTLLLYISKTESSVAVSDVAQVKKTKGNGHYFKDMPSKVLYLFVEFKRSFMA
jgi:hypothetical protein